jgi:exosortase K
MDMKKEIKNRFPRARVRFACIRTAAALAALAFGLLLRLAVISNESSLKFVLSPFARAVSLFSGCECHWESGKGYVIPRRNAVLNEECSGLAWFSLAFPLLVFLFFPLSLAAAFDKETLFRHFMKALAVSAIAAFAANLLRLLSSQAFGPIKEFLGLDFYSAHHAEGLLIFLAAFLASVVFMKRSEKHG